MKSVLFALVALLLAATACTAQDSPAKNVLRFRALTMSDRKADDTWGPNKTCGGVFVYNDSEHSLIYRWEDTVVNWYVTKEENLGADAKGNKAYRLKLVKASGQLTSTTIRQKGRSCQFYFFDKEGHASMCFETEVMD